MSPRRYPLQMTGVAWLLILVRRYFYNLARLKRLDILFRCQTWPRLGKKYPSRLLILSTMVLLQCRAKDRWEAVIQSLVRYRALVWKMSIWWRFVIVSRNGTLSIRTYSCACTGAGDERLQMESLLKLRTEKWSTELESKVRRPKEAAGRESFRA